MKLYFTIHNQEEEQELNQELRNGSFDYRTLQKLPNGGIQVETPYIKGDDIEYLTQCYRIEKITD
jgi:hypothetical protein